MVATWVPCSWFSMPVLFFQKQNDVAVLTSNPWNGLSGRHRRFVKGAVRKPMQSKGHCRGQENLKDRKVKALYTIDAKVICAIGNVVQSYLFVLWIFLRNTHPLELNNKSSIVKKHLRCMSIERSLGTDLCGTGPSIRCQWICC
jgi:hypothetical protein